MGEVIAFPDIRRAQPVPSAPVHMWAVIASMAKPPPGVSEAMAAMDAISDVGRRLWEVPTLPGEARFLKQLKEITQWMG